MKKGFLVGISLAAGFAGGAVIVGRSMKKLVNLTDKSVDLYKSCYNIAGQWITHKQRGVSLEKYFIQKGYHSIAIYGMGKLGSLLYDDLKDSSIEIRYGIDQDPYATYPGLNIINPNDDLEDVDVIVVTPVMAFNGIAKMLSEKTDIPLVSISEVVYDI